MFAENQKLSLPQIQRIFLIELFGTFSLTMPAIVTRKAEYYGIFPLLIGGGIGAIYLYFLLCVNKKIGGNYGDYINVQFGKAVQKGIISLYLIRFLIKNGYTMLLFLTLIQERLLERQGKILMLLPLLILCGFVAYEGVETRGRVLEVLAFFIFVPLFVTILLSVPDIAIKEWVPKGNISLKTIFHTSIFVFLAYNPIEFVLFYGGSTSMSDSVKKKGDQMGKAVFRSYGLTFAFHCILFLTTIGLFGVQLTKNSLFPVFSIMETAKLPADFISRLDILLIAFWIFCLFGVISGYSTYGMWFAKDMIKGKKKGILIAIFLFLSGLLTLFAPNIFLTTDWYFRYLLWFDLPISIIIPMLLLVRKKRRIE